jgi:hypothetical protein
MRCLVNFHAAVLAGTTLSTGQNYFCTKLFYLLNYKGMLKTNASFKKETM